MTATLDNATHLVIKAWTDHGKAPTYHKTMQAMLRREWPTLAHALDALAVLADKPKAKHIEGWEQLPLPDELLFREKQ